VKECQAAPGTLAFSARGVEHARRMSPRHATVVRLAAVALAAIATTFASSSRADDRTTPTSPNFGRRSHLIVTAENILGGSAESISRSSTGDSTSFNSNGLFAGYTGPRFGVHAAFGPSITAGSGIGVWAVRDTTSKLQASTTSVIRIAPRVGWIPALGPLLALWLRAGPTFVVLNANDRITFVDLSFDALVAWTPYQHFGVIAGPAFDVGVSGKSSGTNDLRYQSSAFFIGLFVDL
jgi:hypothetical protein